MKLYSHPISQHSRRVLIVCRELGLEPEVIHVALEKGEHKAPAFAALNPACAVPVLDDAGLVLAESHAIMRYLCSKHGGERLYPQALGARAHVDQWLDWNHVSLNAPIQTLAIQTLFAGDARDPAIVERAQAEAGRALLVLDRGLAMERGIGGALSLADIAIGTTLSLYAICKGSFEGAPRAKAWWQELEARPSFTATAPSFAR